MDEIGVAEIRIFLSDTKPIDQFDAVIVVLFFSGKMVLVKNRHRAWEFPGGRRMVDETYEETARRESLEEAGAMITDIRYAGYYIKSNGERTVITSADVTTLMKRWNEDDISHVGLFDDLPVDLSFADGREQIILDFIKMTRFFRSNDLQS